MAINHIPHASFPFNESPWVAHFHDADQANRRAMMHAASGADIQGHDAFARHILNASTGENPFLNYTGPFGEGQQGRNVVPAMPSELYAEHFGDYTQPGGAPGMGPFADPTKSTIPGASQQGQMAPPPGSSPFPRR